MSDSGSNFDWKEYNGLLLIGDAAKKFQEAGGDKFVQKPEAQALLREANGSSLKYTLSLVHRHFALEEGERMVSKGNVTKPEKGTENNYKVVPSSWNSSGSGYEWTNFNNTDQFVPDYPENLLKRLGDLLNGISEDKDREALKEVLGISLAQAEQLGEDFIWWENTDDAKRAHCLYIKRTNDPQLTNTTYKTAWIPASGSAGQYMACCGVCHHNQDTSQTKEGTDSMSMKSRN
ncbi:hypothetical protein MD484_g1979, partial [Candolleomyces efflorescens]